MNEVKKCDICGCELSENEVFTLHDMTLCEDCHMEETHPVKVCNPLPVIISRKTGNANKDPINTLNYLQKSIYNHIMSNKKATVQQLCREFKLTETKLTNQIAVLRHLQLIKGKEEHTVCFVPF